MVFVCAESACECDLGVWDCSVFVVLLGLVFYGVVLFSCFFYCGGVFVGYDGVWGLGVGEVFVFYCAGVGLGHVAVVDLGASLVVWVWVLCVLEFEGSVFEGSVVVFVVLVYGSGVYEVSSVVFPVCFCDC